MTVEIISLVIIGTSIVFGGMVLFLMLFLGSKPLPLNFDNDDWS